MYTIKNIIQLIEDFAPLAFQENYDNAGLIVGQADWQFSGALLALDVTEAVVEEAINLGCNLIISHHPVIFSGLKKLTAKDTTSRIVIKSIENKIALYAAHTNLDQVKYGISWHLAELIGLKQIRVLEPLKNKQVKLRIYVPQTHTQNLLEALWRAGAGKQGNYSKCSFKSTGVATFKPELGSKPFIGQRDILEAVQEDLLELNVWKHLLPNVLKTMYQQHPYEEPAYDIVALDNTSETLGLGAIGNLDEPCNAETFIALMKKKLDLNCVRTSVFEKNKIISKIALCGGSGASFRSIAEQQGADIYITGDCKYHDFTEVQNCILADIGHFESERFACTILKQVLEKHLAEKFIHISIHLSNPIIYR